MNLNPKGHIETVGLSGSGLSYRTRRRKFDKPATATHGAVTVAHVVYLVLIALVILWLLAYLH